MNVQAFYKALARVLSERTETEIKVKEIAEYGNNEDNNRGVQRTCVKGV